MFKSERFEVNLFLLLSCFFTYVSSQRVFIADSEFSKLGSVKLKTTCGNCFQGPRNMISELFYESSLL